MNARAIVKRLVPPIVVDASRPVRQWLFPDKRSKGQLQEAGYYDRIYNESAAYRGHYTGCPDYLGWSVLVDRVMYAGAKAVLDLGCGPGQVAALFWDRGLKDYLGLDFSPVSIGLARRGCPEYRFAVADLSTASWLDGLAEKGIDTIVSCFFLEHIQPDLEILRSLPGNVKNYHLVPSFDDMAHVRFFPNTESVRRRYEGIFSEMRIDAIACGPDQRYYLIEARR